MSSTRKQLMSFGCFLLKHATVLWVKSNIVLAPQSCQSYVLSNGFTFCVNKFVCVVHSTA